MPTGRTPGRLSSATRQHAISVQYAAQGGEEEAAEGLAAALGMEIEEDRGSEGEEGGDGTQRALGAL